jgi:hypothetical protein
VPSVVSSQPAQALALTMTMSTAEFRLDIQGRDGPAVTIEATRDQISLDRPTRLVNPPVRSFVMPRVD